MPHHDRCLWVEALLWLVGLRISLCVAPFPTLRCTLERVTRFMPTVSTNRSALLSRVTWAIESAARFVPRASCLAQALAAQALLARRAKPTSLYIGVTRNERSKFEAHAWVECENRIVVGGAESQGRYTTLTDFEWKIP
jgi:hypothetical protein